MDSSESQLQETTAISFVPSPQHGAAARFLSEGHPLESGRVTSSFPHPITSGPPQAAKLSLRRSAGMPRLPDQLETLFDNSAAASEQGTFSPAGPNADVVPNPHSQSPPPEPANPLPLAAMALITEYGYVPGKVLGSGYGGIVIQAHSHNTNENVAIKVCDIKVSSARKRLRVRREVKAMAGLKGKPNIIELYDIKTTEEFLLLIMELAEGGDLLELIQTKGKFTENLARLLFKDLLTGLKSCHDNYIVHGDVKCDNCLLDREGTLKLTDLGFAAPQHGGRLLRQWGGTHAYSAPEKLLRKPYDGFAADIWSTGAVLYTMVYGSLPFEGTSRETVLEQVAEGPSYPPEVSDSCRDLLQKMLCHDPGERITLTGIMQHSWTIDNQYPN